MPGKARRGAGTILTTVCAPCGESISAAELAQRISDRRSLEQYAACVFAFFSEVSERLQREFIKEMGVDPRAAANVAAGFAKLAGFILPLATPLPEMSHSPKDEADV
ncbi:hypothetical protein [Aliiroseovarius sp. xm-v-208]|uniref:hypothetical protein n=1 Tax=Aliiroseovarius sp. xm-v-208 TaxID=2651835 RepID=UPI001567E4D8|nr:hypothetical protein [Aliiroseovarius sp. xm-v-208]NRQ10138.1 hypothetical protein [Aliiroseovarius sp. xm-v-208]